MPDNFGASPGSWAAWRALGVEDDLLPAVANPDAKPHPLSKLTEFAKTPSRYMPDRTAIGIAKWTTYQPSAQELERWAAEPDYSLLVQTRGAIKAFDIDVDDIVKAAAIEDVLIGIIGPTPIRYRADTGKCLIPVKLSEPLPKRVLQVEGGMVEMLGVGQQFVADGLHHSGTRYQWTGPVSDIHEINMEQFEQACSMLEMCFGTDGWKVAREKREGTGTDLAVVDDVVEYLVENWETRDAGKAGQLNIRCPFDGSHTGPSSESSTAYFPAGTGGFAQGHFVCLHAHCQGREDRDFLEAVGYSAAQFADLAGPVVSPNSDAGEATGEAIPALQLVRDGKGRIEPSADNMVKLCVRPDQIKKSLAFDEFRDELVWAPPGQPAGQEQWRAFTDVDYTDVQIELERRGVKPMSMDGLRRAIKRAAFERHMDTAKEWLGRLQWDGVERLESFCIAGWGWGATPYSAAVGRYIWTAMAGRVLDPGCQADMAPILVGPQGAGKTSAIKAMVPSEEHYVSIPLDDHDDNTSRRLRGKLVGELEELRGLNSRAIEVIKAWITRTSEGWIPKYMEFEATFKRRLVFIGSTNEDEFLADPTGERRWLPGRCGDLDVEWIKTHRDQLWAEGAVKFLTAGVDWQDAQTLGRDQHQEFKVSDSWAGSVARWLIEPNIAGVTPTDGGSIQIGEVLAGAVGIQVGAQDRAKEMRMAKVLKELGWTRKRLPADADGRRAWGYVKEEK